MKRTIRVGQSRSHSGQPEIRLEKPTSHYHGNNQRKLHVSPEDL